MSSSEGKLKGRRLDVEDWIEFLKDETFETVIIPFSYRQAQAVLHAADDRKFNVNNKVTSEDKEVLNDLAVTIDANIVNWREDGTFIRLSKRSPKDAALHDPNLREAIFSEIHNLKANSNLNFKDKNNELTVTIIAITKAVTKLLKARNGNEALDLLVRSQRRILVDLTLQLLQESEAEFRENIILRRFVELRPELEFRGFVCNNILTALSQYNSLCFVPELVERADFIKENICKYWEEKVNPLLNTHFEKYIIDFAILDDSFQNIKVIELNPFGDCTHACLFDWKENLVQLENGPFEFRVTKLPVKGVREKLAPELRTLLNDILPAKEDEKSKNCLIM